MLICRNAEAEHGQRRVANPWSRLQQPQPGQRSPPRNTHILDKVFCKLWNVLDHFVKFCKILKYFTSF